MIGYSFAVILMVGLFANTLITRPAATVDIIKERTGQLYSERRGYIENTYLIKINNMSKVCPPLETKLKVRNMAPTKNKLGNPIKRPSHNTQA